MAIYTKKGDQGETSLYDASAAQKRRVSKNSARIQAIGSVDELNSYLGVVISNSTDKGMNKVLKGVQKDLLTIGSILAGSDLKFFNSRVVKLERIIDDVEGRLPVLKNFILPGGSNTAAHLHYARSVARRMERSVVFLKEAEKVKPQILVYINRLSDFLFMLARNANYQENTYEEIWVGKKNK